MNKALIISDSTVDLAAPSGSRNPSIAGKHGFLSFNYLKKFILTVTPVSFYCKGIDK